MKNQIKFLVTVLSLSIFISSCSSEDITPNEPLGDYDNGYFILNEGGSALPSPVTFVSEEGLVIENAFEDVNSASVPVGTFLQDLFFDETNAYITSGSASSLTIANRYTLEFVSTVSADLENPRYGVVFNGKAYVTNTGSFSTSADDFVTIIDLTTFTTSKVTIGTIANRIVEVNGKIYITNGNFGSGNSLTVLNPSDSNSLTTIDFGAGNSPDTLEEKNGSLYVLTANSSTNGKVFQINTTNNSVTSTLDLPATLSAPKNLDIDGNNVYFTNDKSVYTYVLGANSVATTPIVTYESTSQFGSMYGFSANNNIIYISDAGDFASSGSAFEYDLSGTLLKTITTDIAPNSFHFN